MQSPKNILTGMALGAVILTTQATAQTGAPEARLAASTQGAKVHTFNYSLGSSVETDGASVDAADGVTGQERPDVRKYAEIGKANIGTATVKLGEITTDASDAGKSAPAKPQERPDVRKYADMGKASLGTATVTLGAITTDASDAGKSSPAKPQERPDMRKYADMGKFGKPSTATITLGASSKGGQSGGKNSPVKPQQVGQKPQASSVSGATAVDRVELDLHSVSDTASDDLGNTCQIVDVLEDSAAATSSYAAGAASVRTQATANASIARNATDPANISVLEGELQASLAEQVSVFGLSAATSRISVGANREVPQGPCGTVTSRSAGARVELGGTTVRIVREQGDALMQEGVEQVTLRDRVLINAGPVAILVAPLVSTRADLSIEAGSLGRDGHLGMRGFLRLNSSGFIATKVVGGKSSKDAAKIAELDFDAANNMVEIHERDAAAIGSIRLEVGMESREDSLGAL